MFARSRTRGIRPITIGRQLVDTLDSIASTEGTLPNAYLVRVSPSDLALLEPVKKPLMSELRQAITNHARFEGYALAGEPLVTLVATEDLAAGQCRIEPTVAEASAAPDSSATPVVWRLEGEGGLRFEIVGDHATIGRQATCTVHIPDTNVSRVHAEMRKLGDTWTVEDRGSTNGTKVNGSLIVDPTPVQPGDTLSFGSVTLTFVRG